MPGVQDAGGSLSAVHDLQLPYRLDTLTALRQIDQFYFLGGSGNAVVEGQKHMRLLHNRFPDALVDFSPELQKRTHVHFQEPCPVPFIDVG